MRLSRELCFTMANSRSRSALLFALNSAWAFFTSTIARSRCPRKWAWIFVAACAIRVASTLGIRPASLRKGWAIPRRTLQRSRRRDLAGFWDSFWPHSFGQSIFGEWLLGQQQAYRYYRISAPPEVEELLLGGLTD